MKSAQKIRKHVVVIGGGFAGLWCVRGLAKADVQITLIDRANHHLFQPLLYQVATAGLSAGDIAAPLRTILRNQANVSVRMDDVSSIDTAQQQVGFSSGKSINYDYLVVASGASHAYFGNPQWAAHAPGLKTLDDALVIRRRLLLAFENAEKATDPAEQEAWLSFAVVGAGPTGVELAGTLAEIARHTLRSEFRSIDPARAKIRLIEAGPRVLASFPESLSRRAQKQLERLGVDVQLNAPVQDIDANGYTRSNKKVAARTVLWAAGVAASELGKMLEVPCDRAGRVLVEPDLRIPGHNEVFVAGDLASLKQKNGAPVPGVAPAAKQMGRFVAQQIAAEVRGRVHAKAAYVYRDYGNLATIGRLAAVVDLRGIRFSGVLAWAFWLAAHVFFLIGFRNRLVVLTNWAWAYWTYQRHSRIVLGGASSK